MAEIHKTERFCKHGCEERVDKEQYFLLECTLHENARGSPEFGDLFQDADLRMLISQSMHFCYRKSVVSALEIREFHLLAC